MYETEAAVAYAIAGRNEVGVYGGFPEAERVIVRFGNQDEIGYEEPYPISVLHVFPVNEKFSDQFTHRDILGACMSLGIEREVIGDILLKENHAWIFVLEKMAEHLCGELTQVRHTSVRTEIVEEAPADARPKRESVCVNVASSRLDNVVAGFCGISRSKACALFPAGKVFVNGMECQSKDKALKENDSVTVRGYGKFIYKGIQKQTKKKREVVVIERYG